MNLSKQLLLKKLEKHKFIDNNTGCWLWTGYCSHGYGKIYFEGKTWAVTRLSLYLFKDFDLNSKLEACHIVTCKRKNCFNPEHLYPGDHYDNMQDKIVTSRKDSCTRGHKFIKDNIIYNSYGQRTCKTCRKLLRKNYYLKYKA